MDLKKQVQQPTIILQFILAVTGRLDHSPQLNQDRGPNLCNYKAFLTLLHALHYLWRHRSTAFQSSQLLLPAIGVVGTVQPLGFGNVHICIGLLDIYIAALENKTNQKCSCIKKVSPLDHFTWLQLLGHHQLMACAQETGTPEVH